MGKKIASACVSLCGDVIAMREPGRSLLCFRRVRLRAAGAGGLQVPSSPAPAIPRAGSTQPRAAATPTWKHFPARSTQKLPNSLWKIPEGECQPLAWTVMFPLWLPVWWMSRSSPIRRSRYAPAILFFTVAAAEASRQRPFSFRKQDFS